MQRNLLGNTGSEVSALCLGTMTFGEQNSEVEAHAQLDRALAAGGPASLTGLVDLDAVRGEIRRKINKDSTSAIDRISDGFIDWLTQGIRSDGTDALDRLVTLEWVQERLLSKSTPSGGLLPAVSRALFDAPLDFSIRLGTPGAEPVFVRMRLGQLGWRVTALYY